MDALDERVIVVSVQHHYAVTGGINRPLPRSGQSHIKQVTTFDAEPNSTGGAGQLGNGARPNYLGLRRKRSNSG
jgi:hypothetical protein